MGEIAPTASQLQVLADAARRSLRVIAPGWPPREGDVAYELARALAGARPPLLAFVASRDDDPATMAVAVITEAGRRAVTRVA